MRLMTIASLLLILPSWALAAPAGTSDYNQWRAQQNDAHYAIQLIASASESRLPNAADIEQVKAVNPSLDVVYQRKHVKGKVWHALLWGSFDSPERALQANRGLPDSLRNDSPWVRKISSLPAREATGSPAPAPAPAKKTRSSGGLQGELAAMLLGNSASSAPKPAPPKPSARRPKAQAAPVPKPRVRRPDDKSPRAPSRRLDTSGLSKNPSVLRDGAPSPSRKYTKPTLLPPGNYTKKGWENSLAGDDHPSEEGLETYIPRQGTYPYARFEAGQISYDATPEPTGTQMHFNLGLDVGYYVATELGYTSASGIKANGGPEIDLSGLEASLLFKLPIDGELYRQWIPYVQVGLFDWETEGAATTSDSDLFIGAGLDYKLNTHWAIGLRTKQYDFSAAEATATTLNLSWRWQGRN